MNNCTPLCAKHISQVKMLNDQEFGLLEIEMLKNARRCSAKHISKSKAFKTDGLGALLKVEMLKKGAASWCEAHFQVKM